MRGKQGAAGLTGRACPLAGCCWGLQAPALPGSRTRRGLQVWKDHTRVSALLAWLPKPGRKEVVKVKKCNLDFEGTQFGEAHLRSPPLIPVEKSLQLHAPQDGDLLVSCLMCG